MRSEHGAISNEEELLERAKAAAEVLVDKLKLNSLRLVLAESCTAGLISSLLARTPGASCVLYGSYVCYTREAKSSMLGLNEASLSANGLVSRQTAVSMAQAALKKSGAGIAASVTGLAGPSADGSDIPVGTVWIALASCGKEQGAFMRRFSGGRNEVRLQAAIFVLEEIMRYLGSAEFTETLSEKRPGS